MKNWRWDEKKIARLLAIFCGNTVALALAKDLILISHFYDDLIDRDKPITDADIHAALWRMLVELPANPFYVAHIEKLWPVFATAILDFRASNDLALLESPPRAREIANVTRYSLINVLQLMAGICGGAEHAGRHAGELRLMFQDDDLCEWIDELEEVSRVETQG